MSKRRFPWYVASIISAISFFVLAIVILIVFILLFSDFNQEPQGFGGNWLFIFYSAPAAFIISSVESLLLSKDNKFLALLLTWALVAVLVFIALYVPPPI